MAGLIFASAILLPLYRGKERWLCFGVWELPYALTGGAARGRRRLAGPGTLSPGLPNKKPRAGGYKPPALGFQGASRPAAAPQAAGFSTAATGPVGIEHPPRAAAEGNPVRWCATLAARPGLYLCVLLAVGAGLKPLVGLLGAAAVVEGKRQVDHCVDHQEHRGDPH